MKFTKQNRNWVEYRELPKLLEHDFHRYNPDPNAPKLPYHELMDNVYKEALEVLKTAQNQGKEFVLFTHGLSTSRMGETTTRSQIRKLMKGKDATPYIIRKNCIQQSSVFVAAIRPKSPVAN